MGVTPRSPVHAAAAALTALSLGFGLAGCADATSEEGAAPQPSATAPSQEPGAQAAPESVGPVPSETQAQLAVEEPPAPSGALPADWEAVPGQPGGIGFALPTGYVAQEVPATTEGMDMTVYSALGGALLVSVQHFSGALAAATPEDVLQGAVSGAVAGGGLEPEIRETFEVAGRPAAEIGAVEPTTGGYVSARVIVDDGPTVLSIVVVGEDAESAQGLLDEAWDTVRLP